MRLRALDVFLGRSRAGTLIQVGQGLEALTRFVPDPRLWRKTDAPILSWGTVVADEDRAGYWLRYADIPFFNARGGRLPSFFQNLLPEGMLRDHVAHQRSCARDDHFELLAACGLNLPGAVTVFPAIKYGPAVQQWLRTAPGQMVFEEVAEPMTGGAALAGVQPKLAMIESNGRYFTSQPDLVGTAVIAKFPTTDIAPLPELEELSLRLAAAAGVKTSRAKLVPIAAIADDVPFALSGTQFLAVERFDRVRRRRIRCEEFAQIFGMQPDEKYSHPAAVYSNFAAVLAQMGREDDVLELLRRLLVNELLGNSDAHAKNVGIIYVDGEGPRLSPAYDIVAQAAFVKAPQHALPLIRGSAKRDTFLDPLVLRTFCAEAGMLETRGRAIVRGVVESALDQWPPMIEESRLPASMKNRLLEHVQQSSGRR
ncbi:MAG: HipA domain-containing protein [Burkholderiales bacterium]|nr:HipA domain-containing protein [Burkholderiales bacterium]